MAKYDRAMTNMMPERKLFLWQNMASEHQSALNKSLAERFQLTVFNDSKVSEQRQIMGWEPPDLSNLNVHYRISDDVIDQALESFDFNSISIFSGIHAYPNIVKAMQRSMMLNLGILGAYVEPWNNSSQLMSIARYIKARRSFSSYGNALDFLLCVGQRAVSQYSSIGYDTNKLFEFGYFLEPSSALQSESKTRRNIFHVFYVGRIDKNKRLIWLLRALSGCKLKYKLTVIGDGPSMGASREKARSLGIDDNIDWLGFIPNSQARHRLCEADLLVLPSKYDGWGAVVNEALLAGARVLVSDNAGSSCLVTTSDIGRVFPHSSFNVFRHELLELMEEGPSRASQRRVIIDWAEVTCTGSAGATYLSEIIEWISLECAKSGRPIPPWRRIVQ